MSQGLGFGSRVARGIGSLLLLALSSLAALLLAELAAQTYANQVAQVGKLFRSDPVLGWAVMPDLDFVRRNAAGDPWRIVTDASGLRGPSGWTAGTRILLAGDSFAFGEGVDVEQRFDSLVARQLDVSILNVGVMGYGTDQQLLAARPRMRGLRAGDVLLVLSSDSDFSDLVRRRHSGRSKPWYSLRDAVLEQHPPVSSLRERLRDASYIFARLSSLLEGRHRIGDDEVARGAELYSRLLADTAAELESRGVRVVIASHGIETARNPEARRALMRAGVSAACATRGVRCVALDHDLGDDPSLFLPDRHWTPAGHAVVAHALVRELSAQLEIARR